MKYFRLGCLGSNELQRSRNKVYGMVSGDALRDLRGSYYRRDLCKEACSLLNRHGPNLGNLPRMYTGGRMDPIICNLAKELGDDWNIRGDHVG